MSTLSKSPVQVARATLAVATKVLRPYAHKNSPKLYTQPQLFVCLVLKTFFKTDYRGITALLHDLTELQRTVGLWIVEPVELAARRGRDRSEGIFVDC
jgi:hypothetical protein